MRNTAYCFAVAASGLIYACAMQSETTAHACTPGVWDVAASGETLDGQQYNGPATSTRYCFFDGALALDEYRALSEGGGVVFIGASFHYWSDDKQSVKTLWVMGEDPGYTLIDGVANAGVIVSSGKGVDNAGSFLERSRQVEAEDRSYQFDMARSYDGGKTWIESFSLSKAILRNESPPPLPDGLHPALQQAKEQLSISGLPGQAILDGFAEIETISAEAGGDRIVRFSSRYLGPDRWRSVTWRLGSNRIEEEERILAPSDDDAREDPPGADLAAVIDHRVNGVSRYVGIAAGVAEPGSQRTIEAGRLDAREQAGVTSTTVFEVGSLTKIFTAALLTDMSARGEVSLDDPIAKYLPASALPVGGAGERITLLHLATHTSGLPRNPPNAADNDDKGVFANYRVEDLYAFLGSFESDAEPGAQYNYSNVGAGLLGHILSLRAGKSYPELLDERIFKPLGMNDTYVAEPGALEPQLATPHNVVGEPVAKWDFAVLAGAGGVRSTIADMLHFAAVIAGVDEADAGIAERLRSTISAPHDISGGERRYFPGWVSPSETAAGEEIFWHDGGTGGSRSFLGVVANQNRRQAVVILSNTAFSVNDIGLNLFDPEFELRKVFAIKEITLPPERISLFTGRYALSDDEIIEITAEGGQLFAQATGDQRFPVFAYAENAFFYRVADAVLIFRAIEDGAPPVSVDLVIEGSTITAPRRE